MLSTLFFVSAKIHKNNDSSIFNTLFASTSFFVLLAVVMCMLYTRHNNHNLTRNQEKTSGASSVKNAICRSRCYEAAAGFFLMQTSTSLPNRAYISGHTLAEDVAGMTQPHSATSCKLLHFFKQEFKQEQTNDDK